MPYFIRTHIRPLIIGLGLAGLLTGLLIRPDMIGLNHLAAALQGGGLAAVLFGSIVLGSVLGSIGFGGRRPVRHGAGQLVPVAVQTAEPRGARRRR